MNGPMTATVPLRPVKERARSNAAMAWQELYVYWRSKHAGGLPPSRSAIDPLSEVPRLARNIFLLDIEPGGFRYRLVGSEIAARFGSDMTGKRVGTNSANERMKANWQAALKAAAEEQRPQLIVSRYAPDSKARLVSLVLPLVTLDRSTEMLLGGAFFDGNIEPPSAIRDLEQVDIDF